MKHAILGGIALASALVLPHAGASAQSPTEAERQLMAENLTQADANMDGALNQSEFAMLIDLNAADNLGRAGFIARTGNQARAFAQIDANGDGLLTQAELQSLVQQAQG